ncbi:MAG: hypothetical protein E6J05_11315 [Chloroflexi bacterium]|nr:MAG: hypothetical protein E6J05_11315 [Chloroflexota bacterium]
MTAKRVVIVGGGGAGDAAAFGLRKRGFDGEVAILSADSDRPYDRPYLSKEFLRGEVELKKVFLHDEAEYSKEKIELRLQERVVGWSRPRPCRSLGPWGMRWARCTPPSIDPAGSTCVPGPPSRNGTSNAAGSAESPFPTDAARRSTWC